LRTSLNKQGTLAIILQRAALLLRGFVHIRIADGTLRAAAPATLGAEGVLQGCCLRGAATQEALMAHAVGGWSSDDPDHLVLVHAIVYHFLFYAQEIYVKKPRNKFLLIVQEPRNTFDLIRNPCILIEIESH
jgi:hypothetical protein